MQTNEIQTGRYYSNGKELVRLVIAEDPRDGAVTFRTVAKGRGRGHVGDERVWDRASFAAWVVADVTDRYVNTQGV